MWDLCQSPAPLLEALTICLDSFSYDAVPLPELFSKCTPRLTHLTIRKFSRWPSDQFRNLTHVSLHDQPLEGRQSLPQFLDFLRNSPLLEDLALVASGPDMSNIITDGDHPIVPVELKHMRKIEIGNWSPDETIIQFLDCLIIPHAAEKLIWDLHYIDWVALCHSLFRPADGVLNVSTVRIQHERSRSGCRITDSDIRIADMDTEDDLILFGSGLLANVVHLELVYIDYDATVDDYRHIYQGLPSLSTLSINRRFDIFSTLCSLGLVESQPTLCPNLTAISIAEVDEKALTTLAILARHRANRGFPLKRLTIVKGGRESDIDDLRSIVEDVEVLDTFPQQENDLIVAGLWR